MIGRTIAMDSPWIMFGTPDKNREYFALLSSLPLNKYRAIPGFLRFSSQIQKQLRATPGVIGYSLRAKLFSRNFWTLSVWAVEKRGTNMKEATLRVFRGDSNGGQTVDYRVPVAPGMVVLDALHYIQGHLAPDLAVRWNCKAGKCGSCSAEVNGRPRLTCKTRMDDLPQDQPITVLPMKSFPTIKDLVTNVSWNYRVNRKIPAFEPRKGVEWKISQLDVDRVQEFLKCIECV